MNRYIPNLADMSYTQLKKLVDDINSELVGPDDQPPISVAQQLFIMDLLKQKRPKGDEK